MNLVIDIGNTKIKAAIFEKNILICSYSFGRVDDFKEAKHWPLYVNSIQKIILSNVTNIEIIQFLKDVFSSASILSVSASLKLPFRVDYETPHTLGSDRIAAAAAAIAEFPDQNVLVVDFGTCIKYNVIAQNTFIGGAISPGLQMRYNALNYYTGKLPLLYPFSIQEQPDLIAKNSEDNLHSGVVNGCLAELNYFIENIMAIYSGNLKILYTGGDAEFFYKLSKRKVFLRPYLILSGLNELLEYQKKSEI